MVVLRTAVFSQVSTTSNTIPLKTDNGFSIGIYGGPNTTWVKSYYNINVNGSYGTYPLTCTAGTGSDFSLIGRFKLKEGFFFSAGVSYEMQQYKIRALNFPDLLAILYYTNPSYSTNGEYVYNTYYASMPLMAGYAISKKKWEFSAALGIEFYCNFQNKLTVYNVISGESQAVVYWYDGHILSLPNGLFNHELYGMWNAFGILNAAASYKISRKLSLSCKPVFRFNDPFAKNPLAESFIRNFRQENLSLNIGLIYNFPNRHPGEDLQGQNKKWDKLSLGFNVVPTYITNEITIPPGYYWLPKTNLRFSFSYVFTLQYDLSTRVKLESGIVIDNFNYLATITNTYIGLPIIAKYYFPMGKDQHHSIYIGGGCHLDYPTNISWLYEPAHPFILPLALIKVGYQLNFGQNCYMDANIGYEHSFPNIESSNGTINFEFSYPWDPAQIVGFPNYVFGSIGVGYKF